MQEQRLNFLDNFKYKAKSLIEDYKLFFKILGYMIPPFMVFVLFYITASEYGLYPFGDKAISWCDMNQQYIPMLCEFKDVLEGKSGAFLSMQNAGGMNFYGVYMFYVSSPFSFLVTFVDKSDVSLFMNVLVLLKLMLASLTAYIYLIRKFDSPISVIAIALSLLYAYSGYTMMYYTIITWLDAVYIFPLVLLGLEEIFNGKSFLKYTVFLSFDIICNFYLGYMLVLYILLYVGAMVIFGKVDKKCVYKFILGSFFACLICAVIYIPVFNAYLASARTDSILDNIINSKIINRRETIVPTYYCMAIAIPFLLFKTENRDAKVLRIMFIIGIIAGFVEPINLLWQTGSYMAFPTRYGFSIIFSGLASSGIILSERKENGHKNAIFTILAFVISVVVIVIFFKFKKKYTVDNLSTLSKYSQSLWGDTSSYEGLTKLFIITLVISVAVFLSYKLKVMSKLALSIAVTMLVISEALSSSLVYMVAPSHNATGYKNVMECVDLIDDDSGFYRVSSYYKMFSSNNMIGVNAVGAMGYNNIGHYTSLNDGDYMRVAKQLGYSSYWMETGDYGGTEFSEAFLVNKYRFYSGKNTKSAYTTEHWNAVEQPVFNLGIITDKNIFGELSGERSVITEQVFEKVTGKSGLIKKYGIEEYATVSNISYEYKNKTYYLSNKTTNSGTVRYTIDIQGKQRLYFECFDLYSNALTEHTNNSFAISVGNRTISSKYPSQSSNGFLDLGEYSNTTVEITVTLLKNFYGSSFGVFGEDLSVLERAIEETKTADTMIVNKDKISGSVEGKDGDYLLLSIPYDKGFSARINGKRVKVEQVLTDFMAIKLTDGVNKIDISFKPKGFILGLMVSIIGVILVALYLLYENKITEFIEKKTGDKVYTVSYYLIMGISIVVFVVLYIVSIVLSTMV